MKKKLTIIMAIVVILSGYLIYSLYPRAIIKDTALVDIALVDVERYTEDKGLHEVTGQFDLDLLVETIANYKYKKMPKYQGPYQLKDMVFRIRSMYNHKSVDIVLGNINFVRIDGSKYVFPIIDADELLKEVNLLFEQ